MLQEIREQVVGDDIAIEKVSTDKVQGMYESVMVSLPELIRWTDWARPEYSIADTMEWVDLGEMAWEDQNEFHFCIVDLKTKEILGGCGIKNVDYQNLLCEIGYWIRTDRTGTGIATKAAELCCRFAFTDLELERAELFIHPDNIASSKVAEKLGAKREAILRNRIRLHGSQRDAYLYSILKNDIY